MSALLSPRLRHAALATVVLLTALIAAAPPGLAQETYSCPYGYFYSDGSCLPYSWYAPFGFDDAVGPDYWIGGRRGGRPGFSGGGFHGRGFGHGYSGGGHR